MNVYHAKIHYSVPVIAFHRSNFVNESSYWDILQKQWYSHELERLIMHLHIELMDIGYSMEHSECTSHLAKLLDPSMTFRKGNFVNEIGAPDFPLV